MKTFLFRSIIGIFFGAFLAIVFTTLFITIGGNEMIDGSLFIKNALGSIFCGWFFSVSPLYFENENLRLSQQTALHFVTVFILYFVIAFWIEWIPFNLSSFAMMFGIFLVVYAIIWTSFYLYFKNEAKKINAEINDL